MFLLRDTEGTADMNDQINLKPLDDAIEWATREDAGRHVDGDPRWNQSRWLMVDECGTACCVAGRIALQAGWVADDNDPASAEMRARIRHPETDRTGYVLEVADQIIIGDYADDSGSVPYEIVSELYDADNDLEAIRRYRDQLAAFAAGETA